ncbi:MAG: hypothetical protein R3350_01985 [Saprospiraceae bacterium]|nr:hypothetical protein [Saprospiraceae bacterium]
MDIRYVKREEIDRLKWDSCVHYAINGNIFGYSWFLDNVAKQWDGLVEGDYESVFPLVYRRSGLIPSLELFQPPLMRAMGIYSVNILSPARIRHFLEAIPDRFRKVDIRLNDRNRPPRESAFSFTAIDNHRLPLNRPYDLIAGQYADDLSELLEAASRRGLKITSSLRPEKVAGFYRKHSRERRHLTHNFHALQRIMYNALHRGRGFASGVMDEAGELCSVDFYLYSHDSVLSLCPVSSPAGRARGALAFQTDMLIRTHTSRPIMLDFNSGEQGPHQPRQFGARKTTYYQMTANKRFLGIY